MVARRSEINAPGARVIDLGDGTILPGFIELHSHLLLHGIPLPTVLRNGITTARDLGGPLQPPSGGDGSLRLLTAGPILTNPGGYPIAAGFHDPAIAAPVSSDAEARAKVRELIAGGAAVIKIGLDRGGEAGAPWSEPAHGQPTPTPWPLMPTGIAAAIVDEAHRAGRPVVAHVGEPEGVQVALDAGVDEFAHVPCDPVPEALLRRVAAQGVKVIGTLDTLSRCAGVAGNTVALAAAGATFLYGAEIAHTDIPWGIDAQELHLMLHLQGKTPIEGSSRSSIPTS